ncbi:peptidylprolyl isomerase [Haloferula helveola]|uniref:Peptidylprolyl isomerase n=1 Tax=Haloferula helveola TaxID=490095 RepID=A0ABM7R8Z0_9BACT|nr:peptidylprolyl isomerase [Haloferula helveola]
MIRHSHRLFLIAAATALVTQCEKPSTNTGAPAPEGVLATVAGEPITEADLLAEAEWRHANRERVPSATELLDEMIHRRAMLAKARSEGLDEDPATRRRMESILIARLRERDLEKAVANAEITEEELRQAYEAKSGELTRKGQDRFAILFLEASDKSSDERRAEVRARIDEGIAKSDADPAPGGRGPAAMGFGAVAVDYSDDQTTRYRGGDLGWIPEGQESARVPAEVLETGRKLSKGERSEVIETPLGFYVIMKTDARPGGMPAFDQVSPRLHQELLVEKRRGIERAFVESAVSEADVTIDEAALKEVQLPSRPTPQKPASTGPDTLPQPSASR